MEPLVLSFKKTLEAQQLRGLSVEIGFEYVHMSNHCKVRSGVLDGFNRFWGFRSQWLQEFQFKRHDLLDSWLLVDLNVMKQQLVLKSWQKSKFPKVLFRHHPPYLSSYRLLIRKRFALREQKEMGWDENGQRNLVNPWRVSWNHWSFKLSFLPGPWSHREFWSFFFDTPKTAATKLRCCFFRNLGKIFNNTHTSGGDFCFCLFEFFAAAKNFTQEALKNFCCVSFNTKDFHNNRFDRDYVEFNVRISEAQISMGCQGLRPRVGRIPGVPGTWKKSPES